MAAHLKAICRWYLDIGVICDRYHLMARYSKLLDALRAEKYRMAGKAYKQVFKGVRYLLLKGQEKLTERIVERLQLLLDLNRPLSITCILKEELRDFWNCTDE